jgi:hypothetical protein
LVPEGGVEFADGGGLGPEFYHFVEVVDLGQDEMDV